MAVLNQSMTVGLSRYVPFSVCTQMGATPYMTLSVREISPTAYYEVTLSHEYDRSQPVRLQRAELQQMRVAIPARPGSVLIEYRRIGN